MFDLILQVDSTAVTQSYDIISQVAQGLIPHNSTGVIVNTIITTV